MGIGGSGGLLSFMGWERECRTCRRYGMRGGMGEGFVRFGERLERRWVVGEARCFVCSFRYMCELWGLDGWILWEYPGAIMKIICFKSLYWNRIVYHGRLGRRRISCASLAAITNFFNNNKLPSTGDPQITPTCIHRPTPARPLRTPSDQDHHDPYLGTLPSFPTLPPQGRSMKLRSILISPSTNPA